jgi:glycosyltransferase involved in cell wall biosynthesis
MRLTLVITTYNRPEALAAVLATVRRQAVAPDEVIVADDGSEVATRDAIARFSGTVGYPVIHVRQEHEGFRLTRLRNLAIARARGELIVFVDGDMLLHPCFVADHRRHARRGTWIQGVRVQLDHAATARAIAAPGSLPGFFSGGAGILRRTYMIRSPVLARAATRLANAVIAIKGCNQSYWREDLIAVNGFNEEIVGWGPEDKELSARLKTAGIARRTVMFGAVACHLHHAPASRERYEANAAVFARTRAQRLARCPQGLDSHL